MKRMVLLLMIIVSVQLSAQEQSKWLTDYKVALQQSESQDKPILVFVTDNQDSEDSKRLQSELFSSEEFKNINSNFILLKLIISNEKSYNNRLRVHYLKQDFGIGLALVGENDNTEGDPLVDFSSKNIKNFLSFINSKN